MAPNRLTENWVVQASAVLSANETTRAMPALGTTMSTPAMGLDGFRHQALQVFGFRHVTRDGKHLARMRRRQFLECARVARKGDHAGAVRHEMFDNGATNSAAGAGYNGDLAIQSVLHFLSSHGWAGRIARMAIIRLMQSTSIDFNQRGGRLK
jgi:hypothetical protein